MVTPVFSLIWPPFRCICYTTFQRTLCHVSICFILLQILGMLPLCGLLSGQTVHTVCVCCRFPSNIFLVWYFVCNVRPSIMSLSDLPSSTTDTCLPREQAVCLYCNVMAINHFTFSCFLWGLSSYCMQSLFVSLFSLVWFNASKPFLLFQLLIHIWLTAFVTSNNIYIMVCFILCVQIFCNIDYLCLCVSLQFVTGLFSLLPSCFHIAYPCQLLTMHFIHC
jgi:hypothetical protein